MKTLRSLCPLLLAAPLLAAVPARAQQPRTPVSLEARGGLALPLGGFRDDASVDGGLAVDLVAGWRLMPLLEVYGAYSAANFEPRTGGARVSDRGFGAGVRVALPALGVPVDPWVRVGVVSHAAERLPTGGSERRGVGMEYGAGLGFALGSRLSLQPGVTWTRYDAGNDVNVRYLRADVGLRIRP